MLVMTQDAPAFTDRHELVQPARRIIWAEEPADEIAGWRQAIESAGGRMATPAELDLHFPVT